MPGSPDAIVVGAGVAGLAAATALTEGGARVLVLEARGTLGGRASSYVDRATGCRVDNGQHVVLGCYRETFAYLDRIGSREGIVLQPSLEVPIVDRDGRRSTLRCPRLPSPWHLLLGVGLWEAIGWRDRVGAARLLPQLLHARRVAGGSEPMPPQLHGQSVVDWLRRHGQTARLIELLWEPLAVAALNQHVDTAAAAPFVRVLGGVFGPDPRDAAIGLPAGPLSAVFGEPAARYLASRGSDVRVHAPARVLIDGRRARGAEVRGERIHAGAVIAAVPWTGWRTLVDEETARSSGLTSLRDAAMARQSSPIVTVNLWLDRNVLGGPFLGLPGRAFQWAFARPAAPVSAVGIASIAHVSLVSSGADAMVRAGADALIARAREELSAALPAAAVASLQHASVVRERHATFSLAPGQPQRPTNRTPVEGLWLAGDWTETGLPATIEGAIVSGHRAAAAVLQHAPRASEERPPVPAAEARV